MRVLVCVKRVPAPGARINLTADEQAIDTTHLGFTVSPHEECAVEAAVQVVEAHGGSVTVLTVGPDAAEEQLRVAVSVGATGAVLVPIDGPDWDPQRTARAITEAVRAARGGRRTVRPRAVRQRVGRCRRVPGRRARRPRPRPADGQRAPRASTWPTAWSTCGARRRPGWRPTSCRCPACVGVKEGINLPRYPTMKGRLASKKVVVDRHESDAGEGGQQLVRLQRPAERVTATTILGHGPDAAPAVVDLLDELGVLR